MYIVCGDTNGTGAPELLEGVCVLSMLYYPEVLSSNPTHTHFCQLFYFFDFLFEKLYNKLIYETLTKQTFTKLGNKLCGSLFPTQKAK